MSAIVQSNSDLEEIILELEEQNMQLQATMLANVKAREEADTKMAEIFAFFDLVCWIFRHQPSKVPITQSTGLCQMESTPA